MIDLKQEQAAVENRRGWPSHRRQPLILRYSSSTSALRNRTSNFLPCKSDGPQLLFQGCQCGACFFFLCLIEMSIRQQGFLFLDFLLDGLEAGQVLNQDFGGQTLAFSVLFRLILIGVGAHWQWLAHLVPSKSPSCSEVEAGQVSRAGHFAVRRAKRYKSVFQKTDVHPSAAKGGKSGRCLG